MQQPRHAEPNANTLLTDLLRPMLGKDTALAQNSQTIVGHPAWQPDLLITAPGRSAVVVEAEYPPAANVEQEALERLGFAVTIHPLPIEAAIALRYPEEVHNAPDLRAAVNDARFSYCVFTVERYSETPERRVKKTARFPESGWLEGGLTDLADLIRLVSLPQQAVNTAADALQGSIDRVVLFLDELETLRPAINQRIAKLLGMDNVPQTRRMVGAILANALVFHQRVAGIHGDIKTLSEVCGYGVPNPKAETMDAWAAILKINYHPIFDIARRILNILTPRAAAGILNTLKYTAEQVDATGVENSHDLTGRVFQRLIADRKYLATFYTLPTSAALLARLAVAKLEDVDWADAAAVGGLRIGDFACGTGALLSAVYEQIAARHERAGGDLTQLHPLMMAEALYGCDVLPSAVHITGSTLAGAQPNVGFGQSRLYTMPYGRLNDGSVAIGSLEFLNSDEQVTLSNFSDPSLRTGSAGDERSEQVVAEIRDESFDLVIMNPPFTRNVTHEGEYAGTYAAAFAALDTTEADQKAMAQRLDRFKRGTCYHGSAGMASAFVALADKKLKPGGIIALVLPLSAAAGSSWEKFRQMLAENYTDLAVLSIAANDRDLSFSSDTGMAECLVVARKLREEETPAGRAHFTSLRRRPAGFAQAAEVGKRLTAMESVRGVEDGPYGGTPVRIGADNFGETTAAELPPATSPPWNIVRIRDAAVAQTAFRLAQSELWLPGAAATFALPATTLGRIGKMGLYHLSLIGRPPQGCFTKEKYEPTATYPALWNHDAGREKRMVCEPDSQLRAKEGRERQADAAWATASRAHLNQDFRFNSQPLTAAFTERETIGGTAWPNVGFTDDRFDYPFVLWCNSTLGLLSFWWHSNRQQAGRGRTTISAIAAMPILDLRALTAAQLTTAQEIFEEFRDKELLPAYLADLDPNRALLDRRVICDLLGFDETVYVGVRRLAEKWCAEPSVHGGKARPKGVRLAV